LDISIWGNASPYCAGAVFGVVHIWRQRLFEWAENGDDLQNMEMIGEIWR